MNEDVTGTLMPFDFLHPKESGEQKQIALALLECQKVYPTITKNGKGLVQGRSKSGAEYKYNYKYALFQDIMDIVRPILNNKGILFSQKPFPCVTDGNLYLVTELEHAETNGKRCVYYPVCEYSDVKQQEMGGNLTYAKRYSLVVLGIVLEEDTDAQLTEARTAARKSALASLKSNGSDNASHDPETGEVKEAVTPETQRSNAKILYNDAVADGLDETKAKLLCDKIDTEAKENRINAKHQETLHNVLHARRMIIGSKTINMLISAQDAIDAVPVDFRKDGKLEGFLKAQAAVIDATKVPVA